MSSRIFAPGSQRWADLTLSVLRVVAALVLLQHGTQKFFGFPVPSAKPYVLASLSGVAAFLETFGGIALLVGFLTRPVAFVLAGEMAVAYFLFHRPNGFWPLANHGEVPVLLCFIFLYLMVAGAGAWSIDAVLSRRGTMRTAERQRPTITPNRP